MQTEIVMFNSELPSIYSNKKPFESRNLSNSYKHFFNLGNNSEFKVFFASANDFIPNCAIKGFWVPESNGWKPVERYTTFNFVFDKLGGIDPLFNSVIERLVSLNMPIYGHYGLNRFVGDKWECYKSFPEDHSLTRLIEPSKNIEEQIDSFFDLMDQYYISHDDIAVIKPRWGWESRGLYLLKRLPNKRVQLLTLSGNIVYDSNHIQYAIHEFSQTPYIIQSYVDTSNGIPELELKSERHDARFIFSIKSKGVVEFVQCYVKTPSAMLYYPFSSFPKSIINLLENITNEISNKFPYGIFSVDLMRDVSGKWYITEFNDQIGFNIDFSNSRDIEGVTYLMEYYLSEMKKMSNNLSEIKYKSAI